MKAYLRAGLGLTGALCLSLAAGCTTSGGSPTAGQTDVEQFGVMRAVMRGGQTQARISVMDAVAEPNAIAVGALEGLAGEVTIVDGQVWVARPASNGIQITGPEPLSGDQATFLTHAIVPQWHSLTIEASAEGLELESLIERSARNRGVDTTEPFPFKIEGQLTHIDLHVINGYCPIAVDPATIDAQPWRESFAQPMDAIIVGFYAQNTSEVMTHHNTSIHAHAVVTIEGETFTGHIDRVVIEPGMTLSVPIWRGN